MKNIENIMPLVEQPSRYLGTETNAVRKDHGSVRLRMALAFPDMYEIGTSHFGLQILYSILNNREDIAAERVFAPGVDFESSLRSSGIRLASLESGTPLNRFDIVGFSVLYELNYTNILNMLDLAGIPLYASERDESHPMVIAGGPCMCNPEPVADFFDAIVVGDGEQVVIEMAETWLKWKNGGDPRQNLLKAWSELEGVYIPSFFEPACSESGFQTVSLKFPEYATVKRTIIGDLDRAAFPLSPVVPFAKPIHDRLRLEVARGCTRGCRFCQAGMIYRPARERSVETLLSLLDASIASTGYQDVSLLSLSTGDYGCIVELMERLMIRCAPDRTAVSLPSLRAGTLTPGIMNLIKKVRKTGFTIAPEAGSQRLRDVINKNVTHDDIVETVKDAFGLGWQIIKLYFMIGLPTETDEDLEAIVQLVKELRKIKPKGRKGKLNVSIGTFVPKPHTPFQWASQISLEESVEKIEWLKEKLDLSGVRVKWQNPKVSLLEGLFARGDRRLAELLVLALEKGCKFDGWSDKFRYDLWTEAVEEAGIDPNFYTTRKRDIAEPLPWDHIDIRVEKDFLEREWKNAETGELTEDCRDGDCHVCGVCDFENIAPKVFDEDLDKKTDIVRRAESKVSYRTFRGTFSKLGQAKYFGHLEMVQIFIRAVRRAGIPVKYSEGFHPMPKISFDDPLPIGMESLREFFYITVSSYVRPDDLMKSLNARLPEGLNVLGCEMAPPKSVRSSPGISEYEIKLSGETFDPSAILDFSERSELIFRRTNRKGKVKTVDLKEAVVEMESPSPSELRLVLKLAQGKSVRPNAVIKEIFGFDDKTIKEAFVLKKPFE